MKIKKEWINLINKCFRDDKFIQRMDEYIEWEQDQLRRLEEEQKELFDAVHAELERELN